MNVVLAPVRPGPWSVRPPHWCPARPATNCPQFVRCVIPATTRSERCERRPTRRREPSTSRVPEEDPEPDSAISPSIEVSASTRPTNGATGSGRGNLRPSGGTRRPFRASPRPPPGAGDLLGGVGSHCGIQRWTMTTKTTLMRLINYPRWIAGAVSVDPCEVPAEANCCKSQCPTGWPRAPRAGRSCGPWWRTTVRCERSRGMVANIIYYTPSSFSMYYIFFGSCFLFYIFIFLHIFFSPSYSHLPVTLLTLCAMGETVWNGHWNAAAGDLFQAGTLHL